VTVALILLQLRLPYWWFAVGVTCSVVRDIVISSLREWMAKANRAALTKVSRLGKLKTALQMVSIVLLLEGTKGALFKYNAATASSGIAQSLPLGLKTLDNFNLLHVFGGMSQETSLVIGIALFALSTVLTLISAGEYLKLAVYS